MTTARRYPLEPLIAAMRMTPNQALLTLRVSGTTMQEYRARGVTDRVADRLAVKAGFHPFEIWPELAEHRHVEIQRACDECGAPFIPKQRRSRFCSPECRHRVASREYVRRKYATDPQWRASRLVAQAAWRGSLSPRARAAMGAKKQAWDEANRERSRANARAWHDAHREEVNARARERYRAKKQQEAH